MRLQQIFILNKTTWINLFFFSIFFYGCAELDGVFPKFEPNKKIEKDNPLPTPASVERKQEILSEENRFLQKKINKLENEILDLKKTQIEQRKDFLILRDQWEMNFVLLERSVEESLNSRKNFSIIDPAISEFDENESKQKINGKNKFFKKKSSLSPVENYSLFNGLKKDIQTKTFENNELEEDSSLVILEDEVEVPEEPGFQELSKVNLNDLDDPEGILEPSSEILLGGEDSSEYENLFVKESKMGFNEYNDPDLNPPENPLILIRHPGVKKIYNQGMTALIQKNHLHAIKIFENFAKRFPNDIDTDNAFYWIGRSYFELNEFGKAETAFRKVLTLFEHRPTSQGYKTPDSIYMLGKIQFLKKFVNKSKYYWKEVIKRFPGSAASRNAIRELNR